MSRWIRDAIALPALLLTVVANAQSWQVQRLLDAPIVSPATSEVIGTNIQGPSLIRVPDWIEQPLGRYYLYFADHKGDHIRLAYADALQGPWRVHEPGSLHIEQSGFPTEPPEYSEAEAEQARAAVRARGIQLPHDVLMDLAVPHIASPDVHVDNEGRRILMYFHGLESFGHQVTRLALSEDGIAFRGQPEILGASYFRTFAHDDWIYAMAMPGQFYRSRHPEGPFEAGPRLFTPDMRHAALLLNEDVLSVIYSRAGDAPERLLIAEIDLHGDWMTWQEGPSTELLRPERDWEGAHLPAEPSLRSVAYEPVNQLRDPAIYREGEDLWLLYAVAGESGIGIARIHRVP